MNDQILIGILTEIKDIRAEMKVEMNDIRTEMKEMKKEMNERFDIIENRVISLEKSRKEDVRAITDILYSFEQGIVRAIDERIEKRMYM